MKRLILAIIISIITVFAPTQQSASACVVSSADVAQSLADAQTEPRCLELPVGVYTLTGSAGALLNVTADNLEIRGAGIGKTILQTVGITLTNHLQVIQFHGANQRVHDLTIQIGTGYTGPYGVTGISIYDEATGTSIERVEISGGYTPSGSAGAGIATYRTWNHAAQHVTIRDCYLHDMPTSGVVVNSSNNVIAHNRLERIGASNLAHGFYAQGGYNTYDSNSIEAASGYSYHAYKQVPRIDGSGDRFVNNTSVNPGTGHVIVQGLPYDAANTDIPTGQRLTRYTTISDNVFRNTPGHQSVGVIATEPILLDANIFEEIGQAGGEIIKVSGTANGSLIRGNRISTTRPAAYGISVLTSAIIEGNAIDFTQLQKAIQVGGSGADAVVRGNRISRTSGTATVQGIVMGGANGTAADNVITGISQAIIVPGGTVGIVLRDNIITGGAISADGSVDQSGNVAR